MPTLIKLVHIPTQSLSPISFHVVVSTFKSVLSSFKQLSNSCYWQHPTLHRKNPISTVRFGKYRCVLVRFSFSMDRADRTALKD